MDVRCERCRAQYVFDDEQVTTSGLTVQCTNCGHVFKVKKKELVVTVPVKPGELQGPPLPATAAAPKPGGAHVSMPSVPAPSPPPPQRAEPERPREWRVRQPNGNLFTFRELTTLQRWIVEQKVSRDDEISLSGDQWKRLGNIADLASFFRVVDAAHDADLDAAHDADLGADLGADVERAGLRPGRTRLRVLVLMLVAAAAAAAYVFLPPLLAPARRAQEVPVAAAVQAKPESPPEPSPPPAQPVPALEPVAEPALQGPPEPIAVQPAKAAPKGPKALLAHAWRALENGNVNAALELFGRVASQDPSNVEALMGRGLCYLDLENYAPAEASFLAALRLEPGQPDALLGLAETYRFEGKKAEAVSHYEKYLAEHPGGEDAEVARNALAELRK